MKISVGILGVTGYSGQELLRILLNHSQVEVTYLGSRQVQKPTSVEKLLPAFGGQQICPVRPLDLKTLKKEAELVFLALPNGVSTHWTPQILTGKSHRVIDLSGDFRLSKKAVYGLSEWARQAVSNAQLVANPGCYPTAVLLGLLPLVQAGWIHADGVIVDAKSGVTGAGRSLQEDLLFSEVNEDLHAYKVDAHQHVPEMEQALSIFGKHSLRLTFVPHLVPMNRGLFASIYAPLKKTITETALRKRFKETYADASFVRILPPGEWPQTKAVSMTNRCDIGFQIDRTRKRVIVLTAIDNLGKGAAGQAVQNFNLMVGLSETEGLSR